MRPGLLAKYQATNTEAARFAFLKAFLLDPQSLSSLQIESFYVEQSMRDDSAQWVEKPLHIIKQELPESFITTHIAGVQDGRPHPQDTTGQDKEMRMYWVYVQTEDKTTNRKAVGHALRATGDVPTNKAALTTLSDGLVNTETAFGKGKGSHPAPPANVGKGGDRPRARPPKAPKAGESTITYISSL